VASTKKPSPLAEAMADRGMQDALSRQASDERQPARPLRQREYRLRDETARLAKEVEAAATGSVSGKDLQQRDRDARNPLVAATVRAATLQTVLAKSMEAHDPADGWREPSAAPSAASRRLLSVPGLDLRLPKDKERERDGKPEVDAAAALDMAQRIFGELARLYVRSGERPEALGELAAHLANRTLQGDVPTERELDQLLRSANERIRRHQQQQQQQQQQGGGALGGQEGLFEAVYEANRRRWARGSSGTTDASTDAGDRDRDRDRDTAASWVGSEGRGSGGGVGVVAGLRAAGEEAHKRSGTASTAGRGGGRSHRPHSRSDSVGLVASLGTGASARGISLFFRSAADPSLARSKSSRRQRSHARGEAKDEDDGRGDGTAAELAAGRTSPGFGPTAAAKVARTSHAWAADDDEQYVFALEDETDFDFDERTGAPLLPAHARLKWEYLGEGHFRRLPVDAPRNREGWLEARRRAHKSALERLHSFLLSATAADKKSLL
jgi:hypothetical protein